MFRTPAERPFRCHGRPSSPRRSGCPVPAPQPAPLSRSDCAAARPHYIPAAAAAAAQAEAAAAAAAAGRREGAETREPAGGRRRGQADPSAPHDGLYRRRAATDASAPSSAPWVRVPVPLAVEKEQTPRRKTPRAPREKRSLLDGLPWTAGREFSGPESWRAADLPPQGPVSRALPASAAQRLHAVQPRLSGPRADALVGGRMGSPELPEAALLGAQTGAAWHLRRGPLPSSAALCNGGGEADSRVYTACLPGAGG
ncbi:uncharacterized protein LOC134470543 [Cavia porcellus]|uniref:uncharacterized protein LOC134470543 n=1 Tax=Cavia porcellus TaxID=10141 RepID=UPI002FE0B840